METTKQRKKKLNRKQFLTLVIMFSVLLLMLISFAWYYFKTDKEVDSELADVMAPYYLYLLDGEGDSLSLSIGSLHPGETKQVVIGVSNKPADSSLNLDDYLVGKNSQFDYKFALAYTQNLPIVYSVYELEIVEDESDITATDQSNNTIYLAKQDISKDEAESVRLTEENNEEMYQDAVGDGGSVEDIVNYVQYDLYTTDYKSVPLCLETTVNAGSTSYELDYYLIEMEWKDGIEFSNFIKETDLVYVIVDAVQPEPEVKTEAGE